MRYDPPDRLVGARDRPVDPLARQQHRAFDAPALAQFPQRPAQGSRIGERCELVERRYADGQRHHAIRVTQPCVSGTVPRWIADQLLAELGGQLPRAARADGELAVVPGDMADRGDHRGGAAGERFEQFAARASSRHWSRE